MPVYNSAVFCHLKTIIVCRLEMYLLFNLLFWVLYSFDTFHVRFSEVTINIMSKSDYEVNGDVKYFWSNYVILWEHWSIEMYILIWSME